MKDYDLFIEHTKDEQKEGYIEQTFFHYLYKKYTDPYLFIQDNYFNIVKNNEGELILNIDKTINISSFKSGINIIETIPFFNYEKIIRTAFTPINAEIVFSENYFLENIMVKIPKKPNAEDLFFLICFIKTILNFENHHYVIIRTLINALDAIAFIIKEEKLEEYLTSYSIKIQERFNNIEHYYNIWYLNDFNRKIEYKRWYIESKKIDFNKYRITKLNELFKGNYSYLLDENKFYTYNDYMFL